MTIQKILEFPDGHFEIDLTLHAGTARELVKTVAVKSKDPGKSKKQHLKDELQALKNAEEITPVDITAALGVIDLT